MLPRTVRVVLPTLVLAAPIAIVSLTGCPATTPIIDPSQVTGDKIATGKTIYEARRCANCHGADALGKSTFPGAPRIVGRTAADLRQVVVDDCINPNGVDNCHPLKLPDLSEAQLEALAGYLASLAGFSTENPGPVCDDVPGHICTVAGNGVAGTQSGAGILARSQYLYWPQNVTVDPQGRLVITDWNNYKIRRIESEGCKSITDSAGNVGTDCPIVDLVGTGALGDSCSTAAKPVAALAAVMNHPVGILFDDFIPGQHNMIMWGWHQWKIKYVPVNADGTTGDIICLFGNGRGASGENTPAGFNFDGANGPTKFNLPSSCVYDNAGNFYISDQGNLRIRIIRPDADDDNSSVDAFVRSRANNIISTFAGGLKDEIGNFRLTKADYSDSGDGGPIAECTFRVQFGFDAVPQFRLAIDRDRNLLYVADSENNRIRMIDLNAASPIITTVAGGGTDVAADNVPATQARLNRPADVDVAMDGSGDLLITDSFNHCVRIVSFATGMIHTVAGTCGAETSGYSGDGGPATQAQLAEPGGAVLAPDGTVYIADTLNHRIRRVNP